MSPNVRRITILISELLVFFLVTAFSVYFFSYAGALQFPEKEAPPPAFPVIGYDGSRERPDEKGYIVVPWSGWEDVVRKKPGASLMLPEKSRTFTFGEDNRVTFTAAPEGEARQAVELRWIGGGTERHSRYLALGSSIEPRYLRTVTSTTLMVGAAMGFICGLLVGRVLRRRWLA